MTENCNLRCKYCYVEKHHLNNPNINLNILIESLKKIIDENAHRGTKIILHGGEPLTISYKSMEVFLNSVIQYANSKNYRIMFSIQTNGTLIDENWVAIFRKFKIRVGLSLDGCDEHQNQYRIDNLNNNVFKKVMSTISFLKEHKIQFGVIITINKNHIGKEKELLDFIQENRIKCNIRPAFFTKGQNDLYDMYMNPIEYASFFCKIFDIWFNEDNKYDTFYIKEFEEIIRKVINGEKECHSCVDSNDCSKHFLSIGYNGNCYPCNRLYGDSKFYLGNLLTDSIYEIMSQGYRLSSKRIEKLKACQNCEIVNICHGGCPAVSYLTNGDYYEKDFFCEAYKLIYLHVKEVLVDSYD